MPDANDIMSMINGISNGATVLEKFNATIEKLTGGLDKLFEAFKTIPGIANNVSNAAKTAASATSNLSDKAKDATASFGDFTTILKKYDEITKEAGNTSIETFDTIGKLVGAALFLGTNFLNVNEALTDFSKNEASATSATIDATKSFAEMAGKVGLIGGALGTAINNLGQASAFTTQFENTLLSATMSGGNFAEALGTNIDDVAKNMTSLATEIAETSGASALRLGINYTDAVKRIRTVLETLPDEFGKVYQASDRSMLSGKTYDAVEILSQAARGLGQSFETAMKVAQEATGRFGMDAKEGAERLAVMGEAAKKLHLPFQDVNDLVSNVDKGFEFWGTQMEGTIDILGRVSSALKDSGLGFKGQIEIVQNLANGFKNMNVGMEAFIGVSSGLGGGGGAVGAALKVEEMLQEGRMGDLVGMLQDTLTQRTGGRVLTLKEAAERPEEEATFVTQRELLKTMTGIGDTSQLNRVMEAMSKERLGGGAGIAAGEALQNALQSGKVITESQTDLMSEQLEVSREMAAYLQNISMGMEWRKITGSQVVEQTKEGTRLTALDVLAMEDTTKRAQGREAGMYGEEGTEELAHRAVVGVGTKYMGAAKTVGDYLLSDEVRQSIENAAGADAAAYIDKVNEFVKTIQAGPAGQLKEGAENYAEGLDYMMPQRAERRGGAMPPPGAGIMSEATRAVVENIPPIKFEPIDINIKIIGENGELVATLADNVATLAEASINRTTP